MDFLNSFDLLAQSSEVELRIIRAYQHYRKVVAETLWLVFP
jgi:hypothetical protein